VPFFLSRQKLVHLLIHINAQSARWRTRRYEGVFAQTALAPKALDAKTKELIARTDAGRSKVDFAGIGFRVGDELGSNSPDR
jgi:hypothetical protein